MSEPGTKGTAQRPATERAAETVDLAGERIGQLAARLGPVLREFMARAREEVEDMIAEAQSRHRGDQPR